MKIDKVTFYDIEMVEITKTKTCYKLTYLKR